MVIFSELCIGSNQVKSLRLPYRSHPTTIRIKQALNATKAVIAAAKPSAEIICTSLSQLAELYKCMCDVLNLSSTQRLISRDQNKKWVEEVIDESLNLLDVCGRTRDMVTQLKEHVRDLQCDLRRRKCENEIMKYNFFRIKKMKKDVTLLIAGLKQVDNMIIDCGPVVVDSDNHQLAAVMKALKGVSEMTVSVFKYLLLYFSTPVSKPNRWASAVSKLIHKGKVACEKQQTHEIMNAVESIDDVLQALCNNGSSTKEEKMQTAKCRLLRQETLLDCMETRLECIYRHLIGTRASILNIISH